MCELSAYRNEVLCFHFSNNRRVTNVRVSVPRVLPDTWTEGTGIFCTHFFPTMNCFLLFVWLACVTLRASVQPTAQSALHSPCSFWQYLGGDLRPLDSPALLFPLLFTILSFISNLFQMFSFPSLGCCPFTSPVCPF